MTNEFYYGDNLAVLRRTIATETVDLCYLDPPFNSKRTLPTKPMRDEIAAEKYKHPLLDRDDDRLQVVTVAELCAPHDVRLDLPMARADAVKSAAVKGDEDKQVTLDL